MRFFRRIDSAIADFAALMLVCLLWMAAAPCRTAISAEPTKFFGIQPGDKITSFQHEMIGSRTAKLLDLPLKHRALDTYIAEIGASDHICSVLALNERESSAERHLAFLTVLRDLIKAYGETTETSAGFLFLREDAHISIAETLDKATFFGAFTNLKECAKESPPSPFK